MKNLKLKQFGKWLIRQIAWLVLLTIVANFVGVFAAPQVAHAADPKMMLFWAGTCSSPPSGWTDETAAGKAFAKGAYGGIFPRGNSSYNANNGSMGAETHNHTVGGTTTANSGTTRNGTAGSGYNTTAHTHTVTGSTNSISSLPAYKDICVISYPGIPATIPQNAIAFFDTASVPTNWQDYAATFGTNYPRVNTTAGGTGGNNTHAATGHTISSITLAGNTTNVVTTTTGTASRASASGHTHTVTNQTSDTPNTEPPYITVEMYQATVDTTIPADMIAMFDGSSFSSYGWEVLSNAGGPFYQVFPKVTGTYNTTGGATTHHHADKTGLTSSTYTAVNGATGSGGIQGHSHTVTVTEADGTNTNIPPYTDVIFAKKSYLFFSLTANNAPNVGDTITVNAQVNNDSSTNITSSHIKYIIFIDANSNGLPSVGETYITANCAGSGAWADETNYTWEKTALDVTAGSNNTDVQSCTNNNFPSNSTYTIWGKWHNTGDTLTYDTKTVTFTSVPTLTELLFMTLIGCAVFLGVRTGAIKFKMKDPLDDNPKNDLAPVPNHHGAQTPRSNDGINFMKDKDE